jgi:hypothetical protein
LTHLYALGLAAQHCTTSALDGGSTALAGLTQVHRQLTQTQVVNAVH